MRWARAILAVSLTILLGGGLVVLYSASSVKQADSHYFLYHQVVWMLAGLLAMLVVRAIDYHQWRHGAVLTAVALAIYGSLALVLLFDPVNGSRRWLGIGKLGVQPSEFAKVGVIILLAAWMDRIGPHLRGLKRGFVIPGVLLGVVFGLLLLEPDIGSILVVAVVGLSIMFAAGTPLWMLAMLGVVYAVPVAGYVLMDPVRLKRIIDWLKGIEHGEGAANEHMREAINAFIAGGATGVGPNRSLQKYNYLPEAHTDFIFAIVGEEYGLVGTVLTLVLFAAILGVGVWVACRAPDRLGRLLAAGVTVLLLFQAGFNMGMVTGCLPTKGLALPFVSYGGSSMIASLAAVGLLLSVVRGSESAKRRFVRNALDREALEG